MTIHDYTQQLLELLSVSEATITVEETDEEVTIQIDTPEEEAGLLIGYHAETLSAIQRLIRLAHGSRDEQTRRIVVNVNNYRQQRMDQLKAMAEKVGFRVLESGERYVFSYLPANERFVVHTTIAEHPDFQELTSFSEGEGQGRRLVIDFKEHAPAASAMADAA